MSTRGFKSALSRAGIVVALCTLTWLIGFPVYVDCAAFLLCAVGGASIARSKMILLLGSLVVSLILAEAGLRTIGQRSQVGVHYRPEEKFAGESRYQANVDELFEMPHGDLIALDPFLPRWLAQPRRVRFATDSLGYRNDEAYVDQDFVLVGDSMIAGAGNDQDDLLADVLNRDFGIDSYAVAFPTDPSGYFAMIEDFLNEVRAPVRVILFVFEGNDFHGPGRGLAKPSRYDAMKLRAIRALDSALSTSVFHATRRLERFFLPTVDSQTEVYRVGAHPMAFYGSYVDKAVAEALRFEPGTPPPWVMEKIEGVFFIPTKYRVYFSLLDDDRGRRLPAPPPGYLALLPFFHGHEIPVVDLTESMVEAARELLPMDDYVFWRDDTHWNRHGVRVAAKEVAAFLGAKGSAPGPGSDSAPKPEDSRVRR